MISYKFPEEREFILFFSERMGDKSILALLENSESLTLDEAKKISVIFWRMIDEAVDIKDSEECTWPEGYEFWSEKVLQSIAAFLKKSGYEKVLNETSNYNS